MEIHNADCLERLKTMADSSIDSLVTDPPAGISFMGKDWDYHKGGRTQWIAWMQKIMQECLRVLKPGAHGLVWALPRTSHWTATALEQAGFEIRDVVVHIQGQGFPKSRKVGEGMGTALKPANEHWVLIRKPLSEKTIAANVLKHGTGGVNIGKSRIRSDKENKLLDHVGNILSHVSYNASDNILNKDHDYSEVFSRDKLNKLLQILVLKTCDDHHPETNGAKNAQNELESKDFLDDCLLCSCLYDALIRFLTESGQFSVRPLEYAHIHSLSSKLLDALVDESKDSLHALFFRLSTDGFYLQQKSLCGFHSHLLLDHPSAAPLKGQSQDSIQIPLQEQLNFPHYLDNDEQFHAQFLKKICALIGCQDYMKTSSFLPNQYPPVNPFFITFALRNIKDILMSQGRFPANLIVDESAVEELDRQSGQLSQVGGPKKTTHKDGIFGIGTPGRIYKEEIRGASRFFYCAKASRKDKGADNTHPTVKSSKLMEYLITMITPPAGTVLDPFMGSGSTGVAAKRLGFGFKGIEHEAEYFKIAEARLASFR